MASETRSGPPPPAALHEHPLWITTSPPLDPPQVDPGETQTLWLAQVAPPSQSADVVQQAEPAAGNIGRLASGRTRPPQVTW
jgi:hypothetical protein